MPEPLVLPESLDATFTAPLLETLRGRTGQPLSIDASAVSRVSTPVLQLLVAAAESWRTSGDAFGVSAPSPAFRDAVSVLGLTVEQLPMESQAA